MLILKNEVQSLWEIVGNECLSNASKILKDNELTEQTVEMVERLVSIAIAIDNLNLCWEAQNRYGAAGSAAKVS